MQIIGWDIHSETWLVGPSGSADDGLPAALGPFLTALLNRKPGLRIDILIWNFAALYAAEREWDSAGKFTAQSQGRLRFCLDSSLPVGSAQHQKIVVVDNAIAFVGGLDLTIRRWDTGDHLVYHPLRRDPRGKPYPPFHDIQCMVDGEAAAALGEVAAMRWAATGCSAPEHCEPGERDRWPASVPAGATRIPAGIARTELRTASSSEVDEVARLFKSSIAAASRFIYIENQFTSAPEIAQALAQRMADVPSLHVLIVTPKAHSSWLESQAMQGGRCGFIGPFVSAGVTGRLRIVYPRANGGQSSSAVMVHSKLMIVDDGFLRIGSANINNRSMGADTECDIAFEADSDEHRDFIRSLRRRLIGHFCGLDEDAIAGHEEDLLGFIDRHAASGAARTLQPIDADSGSHAMTDMIQPIADPNRPLHLEHTARRMWTPRTVLAVAGIMVSLAGLALAWQYTRLSGYTDVGYLSSVISGHAQSAFAPLFAVAAFVLGGLVVFPIIVLIAATAAALGPWIGGLSATAGVLASALLLFMIGRFLGHKRLQSLLGARAARVQRRIIGQGVVAVALIRMVPIAPFSLVNLLAGASQLRLSDFLIGTLLGMAPGIIMMAALGSQIADFARNASWSNAVPLGLTIVLWIAVCLAVQFVVMWWSGRRT